MILIIYIVSFKKLIPSLLRVIDEELLSEIARYDPRSVFECFHCFQNNYILIA